MTKLSEIAGIIGAKLEGDADIDIAGIAKIEEAKKGEITFLSNPKYAKYFESTEASAVIVPEDFKSARADVALLRAKDPYTAFVFALKRITPPPEPLEPTINRNAYVSPKAVVGENVGLGAFACVLDRARIGRGARISHGSVIGEEVEIGENTLIYPNVTVYRGCKIGKNVIIHSGTVIGSDGFGFAPKDDGTYEKIPQLGIVVVEDDVEIGSNCSIDRATLGETRICRGVKLDNLIQVAHNVVIGDNTVIAAQTGIAGSTRIGKHCVVAGQVGFAGHLDIADRTTIGAQSGVAKSVKEQGKILFGYPAKEMREAKRMEGAARMLPELLQEVAELRAKVEKLTNKE